MIHFVTSDTGNLLYAELTAETKRDYCERHGYLFTRFDLSQYAGCNPYWAQVLAMKDAFAQMDEDDWMNYTGADSFILPEATPCEPLLDENFDLIISCDSNGLNNNGFFLRNTEWGREFLNRVWGQRSKITDWKRETIPVTGELTTPRPNGAAHEWCEQAGFILALRGHSEHVKLVPQALINAYPSELYDDGEDGNFIIHLPNMGDEKRLEYLERALA